MAQSKTKKTPTARERMLSRARERYPDRTFADLGATEPQEGVSDLDEAINEMLEEYANKQVAYTENNDKLRNLLMSDPDSATFINQWVKTGDPRAALVEIFGDDLGMSEEARKNFGSQLEGWRERKSANDKLNEEAEANWQNSLSALEEWGNERGLSMEQKRDVMLRLLAIAFNGMENRYGPEDFDLALNAINHDTDVAAARAEGEVAGRNERISAARRDRNAAGIMPPAPVGGQGGATRERRPAPQNNSPWAGIK